MIAFLADGMRGSGAAMPGASGCFNADTKVSYPFGKAEPGRNDAWEAVATARWRTIRPELWLGLNRNKINRVAAKRIFSGTEETNAYPGQRTAARHALAAFGQGMRRCVMPTIRCAALAFAAGFPDFA